jgi:hypothetical protein
MPTPHRVYPSLWVPSLAWITPDGRCERIEYDGKFHYQVKGRVTSADDPFALFPEDYWEMLTWWLITLWHDEAH